MERNQCQLLLEDSFFSRGDLVSITYSSTGMFGPLIPLLNPVGGNVLKTVENTDLLRERKRGTSCSYKQQNQVCGIRLTTAGIDLDLPHVVKAPMVPGVRWASWHLAPVCSKYGHCQVSNRRPHHTREWPPLLCWKLVTDCSSSSKPAGWQNTMAALFCNKAQSISRNTLQVVHGREWSWTQWSRLFHFQNSAPTECCQGAWPHVAEYPVPECSTWSLLVLLVSTRFQFHSQGGSNPQKFHGFEHEQ